MHICTHSEMDKPESSMPLTTFFNGVGDLSQLWQIDSAMHAIQRF